MNPSSMSGSLPSWLNRFEVYGDEAEAFINEACEKSINAYKNLSGQA